MKKDKPVKRSNFPNVRKAIRKEKRKQKKIHRQEHYLKKKNERVQPTCIPGKFVKRPADDSDLRNAAKKKKSGGQSTAQDIMLRQLEKEKKEANKLKSQMNEQRRKILVQANEEEDKIIKKLEKQLGLNKSKNKNNYFTDDGLDYLLEICDKTTSEQIVAAEKHLANVDKDSDFEEDLAVVTGKNICEKQEKGTNDETMNKTDSDNDDDIDMETVNEEDQLLDENDDMRSSDGEFSENNSDESAHTVTDNKNKLVKRVGKSKEKIISEKDVSEIFSDDEVSHLSSDEGTDDEYFEKDNNLSSDSKFVDTGKPDVWEDIYGRKRDKEGNIIKEEKGIYIPPHLRNKDSTSDKDLVQLKRQIKKQSPPGKVCLDCVKDVMCKNGCVECVEIKNCYTDPTKWDKGVLNKLAGTNLHWACTSIENLYANNSRNSVNTALTTLWLEAIVGPASTPDRMVAEHVALVAVLHANIGSEIGAHFLEELSRKFDDMMQTPQLVEDKSLDNLVSCLALLFSFKIYHALLLYDILTRLTEDLREKNIDCVLAVLRNVGGVLRKEEPAALKTFIHDTQAKIVKLSESAANGSRIKFLLEVLLAVKNNNLNKIPNYDPAYSEHLKKMCRGVVRRGNYVTTLNIRLEDLLRAHERGKWWVVGSAWEGNRALEDKPVVPPPPSTDRKLLELAKKQRMNTDVRRSIFCVIMSAEDYMDAFEKLQHLGLRGQQEREVVHVLLACCLQEKRYNPYYAVLGQKLCDCDRKYQLSIQYSAWDKIKELESLSKQAMSNLAQFLIHLIMEKALPISVLKIIQFSDLNKTTVRFMRQILLAIIMNADLQATLEVFHRISKPPKLHTFRDSLRLFIQHFLIKNAGKKTNVLSDDEMATLKERALEVDKILTAYDTKLRF